ncbi:MAG: response regulator transcription factor [Magnetococcus sp. WYHC-3]
MKQKNDTIKTIFLVDDHPIVRRGIRQIISGEEDMEVYGEASNADEALQLLEHLKPDVVVTDLSMAGKSGIGLIKDILARLPRQAILVLSIHNDALHAERALKAGAKGYITKQDAPDLIVTALQKIAAGEIYICESVAHKLLATILPATGKKLRQPGKTPSVSALSDRELEILELIGQGLGTSRIAKKLNISVNTVETHRAHIKAKLQLPDASALTVFAVQYVTSAS